MNYQQRFLDILKNRGVPVTNEQQLELWRSILVKHGFAIKNDSPQSPFWRAQEALVGEPSRQLIDTLVQEIMPSSFIMLAKDEWLNLHGDGRNVKRLKALKAQGNLVITRQDSAGELSIGANTLIQSDAVNGQVYQLKLLTDITFADGQSEVIAMAEALSTGDEYNLVAGYYNQFVEPIEGVNVINLDDWLVRPGQDIESDENYRLRCRDIFATLGNYHVDAVYRTIISGFAGMKANNIVFDHTAPRGPGTANAYVFLDTGSVSQPLIDEINNHIAAGYHGNGDDMLVLALPSQGQNISATYVQFANTDSVQAELEQFIRCAFRENAAYENITKVRPQSRFSFSKLEAEIHAQFPTIESVSFSNADIISNSWMPTINSLTVTAA